jgi:hypothetical protein
LLLLLLGTALAPLAHAAKPVAITHWESGLTELDEGWVEHDGDDLAWAQPDFDDSAWQTIDLEETGAAQPGWQWYRRHVNVGPDHQNVHLMLAGGDGTYELYVNGKCMLGARIKSQFAVSRPTEREFEISDQQGDFQLALRTHATPGYAVYQLPLFIGVTMGEHTAIEYELQALESERLYSVVPTVAINLLLILAALGALALYASQRTQRDYLFLGLFLLMTGAGVLLWHLQQAGVLPVSANSLIADPLFYPASIAQLEFTLSFARRRVGRGWRIYEAVILLPLLLVAPVWLGHFPKNAYDLLQAIVTAPLVFLLPALLFAWYRRGNREAGWLIIPSLLPAAAGVLYDLGSVSLYLGWNRFDFLIEPIPIGPIPLQTSDAGDLLFLLAIGFVLFFRFTRVSREQARSAAELEAAREIQRRLVPASLPAVPGYRIEAAYIPAQEVGGDFYQVMEHADGSTLVVVGDVSGKGLKAAMTGTLAIGALRTLSGEGLGPAELLARLNREMLRAQDGGFITCLCARLSHEGHAVLANAGHLSPYRNGEEVELESGLPLGIVSEAEYSETALQLAPGDALMLLSDGVVEARNATGELFGFERTAAISAQAADKIAQAAQAFGQEDDITVLTLSRLDVRPDSVPPSVAAPIPAIA